MQLKTMCPVVDRRKTDSLCSHSKPSSLILPVVLGILGLAAYLAVRTEISPKASVDLRISRSEAETNAKNFLK